MRFSYFALALLGAAALFCACGGRERSAGEAPLAIRIAALRSQTAGRGDLWPGFDPDTIPLMVYAGGSTWLFGHPEPPAGFSPVPPREAGEITRAVRQGGRHELAARTGIATLGRGPVVVIVPEDAGPGPGRPSAAADPPNPDHPGDPAVLAALALRLSFQVHLAATLGWEVDGTGFLEPLYLDPEPLALRRLETEALRRALETPDRLDAIAWARRAMGLRAERHGLLPGPLVSTERTLELVEGIAERTARLGLAELQRKAALATDDRPAARPWEGLLPERGFALEQLRERSRAVGAAIAFLLDRLEPNWPSLSAETPPDRLLGAAKAAGGEAELPPELLARERSRAAVDVQARRSELAARYEATINRQGWRIVVETQAGETLELVEPDPAGLLILDSQKILHASGLRLRSPHALVIVEGRDAITHAPAPGAPARQAEAAFVSGLAEEPRVAPGAGGERAGDGTFTVTAEGFRGEFTDSHWEKEGTNLHVVVPARPGGR